MDPSRRAAVPTPLRFLPAFLFERDANVSRYICRAWGWSVVPSLAIVALGGLLPLPEPEAGDMAKTLPSWYPIYIMLGAPVIETLVMVVPLLLLARLLGPAWAALCSGLLWGAAHWLVGPQLGLAPAWSFTLMSVVLITWRPAGLLKAMAIVAAVHALHNSVGAAVLLALELVE